MLTAPEEGGGVPYIGAASLCSSSLGPEWSLASLPSSNATALLRTRMAGVMGSLWVGATSEEAEENGEGGGSWRWGGSQRLAGRVFFTGNGSNGATDCPQIPLLAFEGRTVFVSHCAWAPNAPPPPPIPQQLCATLGPFEITDSSSVLMNAVECSTALGGVVCERTPCQIGLDCHPTNTLRIDPNAGYYPHCGCVCCEGVGGARCEQPNASPTQSRSGGGGSASASGGFLNGFSSTITGGGGGKDAVSRTHSLGATISIPAPASDSDIPSLSPSPPPRRSASPSEALAGPSRSGTLFPTESAIENTTKSFSQSATISGAAESITAKNTKTGADKGAGGSTSTRTLGGAEATPSASKVVTITNAGGSDGHTKTHQSRSHTAAESSPSPHPYPIASPTASRATTTNDDDGNSNSTDGDIGFESRSLTLTDFSHTLSPRGARSVSPPIPESTSSLATTRTAEATPADADDYGASASFTPSSSPDLVPSRSKELTASIPPTLVPPPSPVVENLPLASAALSDALAAAAASSHTIVVALPPGGGGGGGCGLLAIMLAQSTLIAPIPNLASGYASAHLVNVAFFVAALAAGYVHTLLWLCCYGGGGGGSGRRRRSAGGFGGGGGGRGEGSGGGASGRFWAAAAEVRFPATAIQSFIFLSQSSAIAAGIGIGEFISSRDGATTTTFIVHCVVLVVLLAAPLLSIAAVRFFINRPAKSGDGVESADGDGNGDGDEDELADVARSKQWERPLDADDGPRRVEIASPLTQKKKKAKNTGDSEREGEEGGELGEDGAEEEEAEEVNERYRSASRCAHPWILLCAAVRPSQKALRFGPLVADLRLQTPLLSPALPFLLPLCLCLAAAVGRSGLSICAACDRNYFISLCYFCLHSRPPIP